MLLNMLSQQTQKIQQKISELFMQICSKNEPIKIQHS